MRIRRTTMAIVAAGALTLTACTSGTDEGSTGGEGADESASSGGGTEDAVLEKPDLGEVTTKDDQITYSVGEAEWETYSGLTSSTYSVYNSVVNDRLRETFTYFGTDGTVFPNENFGSYEKTSDDPLTVEYTISDEAVWEDGVPITSNDFLLQWASSNPAALFPDGDGAFDPVSATFGEKVTEGPETEVDSKTFTLVFPEPFPDWELMLQAPLPAHVLAREVGLEPTDLAQAILDRDNADMEKVAEFWNKGWVFESGALPDPALVPSSGPYTLDGATWQTKESLTLLPNPNYGGPAPATKELTFRFTAPEAMTQALQNGDINIIQPQPDVDTVKAIEAMGDGFSLLTGPTLTWEHLDFNFVDRSPFSEAKGGLAAREAFALCAPRQQIVDNLVKPIDDTAVVMNLREVFPFQDDYDSTLSAAYDGRYDTVDIEGSKAKLAEAGLTGPVDIKIGYSAPNLRRSNQVAAIKSSCDEAGFNVIDAGDADFFADGGPLATGDYDIALFAWAGSGQVASGESIYSTDEGQNYGKYTNPEVDEAWDILASSIDPAVWDEQRKKIEKLLWDDLATIPVFAHPGVIGADSTIDNIFFNATQTQIAWNAEQWVRSE